MKYEIRIGEKAIVLKGDELLCALQEVSRAIELEMGGNGELTQHGKGKVAGCLHAAIAAAKTVFP